MLSPPFKIPSMRSFFSKFSAKISKDSCVSRTSPDLAENENFVVGKDFAVVVDGVEVVVVDALVEGLKLYHKIFLS